MRAIGNGRIVMPMGVVENAALLFGEKSLALWMRTRSVPERCGMDRCEGSLCDSRTGGHAHSCYLGEDTSDGKVDGLVTMAKALPKMA